MKKTLFRLSLLQEVMHASNRSNLGSLSQATDPSAGNKKVEKLSET